MEASRTPRPIGTIDIAPMKNAVQVATTACHRVIEDLKKRQSSTRFTALKTWVKALMKMNIKES